MKRSSLLRIGALTAFVVSLAPLPTKADDFDKKTIVTFSQPTEVPGIILQPGTYVIKLIKSPSDSAQRHIVEVMNEKMDHLYALTWAVGAEKVGQSGKTVMTFYEGTGGRPQAIRKWFWPGDVTGIEFLYPKAQAAQIAAATNQKVAEGNLPAVAESGQSLTPDNAKGITLQSQNERTPAATPFTANAAEPPPVAAPVVIAQNTPAPSPVAPTADTVQPNLKADSSTANSSDTTLPQTASQGPLIGVIGMISLAGAILIGFVRRRAV